MKTLLKSLALSSGLLLAVHGHAQTYTATPNTKPSASVNVPLATTGAMGATVKTPKPTAMAGGGKGKVWVDSASRKYYCASPKYDGKTKTGEYMTEADAKAQGNRANSKKACL